MTEMVHGTAVERIGDPVLPRWWRTVDRVSLGCVVALFAAGLLLGLAASPPLAQRNGLPPFYYVERQAAFGGLALLAMLIVSTLGPRTVRRLAVLGFLASFVALALLPALGTDFGKGGHTLVLPRLRLRAALGVPEARLRGHRRLADGRGVRAPRSPRAHDLLRHRARRGGVPRAAAGLRPVGAGDVLLGGDVVRLRRADPAPAGDGAGRGGLRRRGLRGLGALRAAHRRLPRRRRRPHDPARPRRGARSGRAGSSASASARGRSSGPCPTRTPTSSSPSRRRSSGSCSSS